MRMRLFGQEFHRAFTNAFRPIASHKDAVVQEETQQLQITLPQISAQKEVVAQAAIEIFHQGTAAVGFIHCIDNSPQYRMKLPRELPIQLITTRPVSL